ncbi:glycosyltransferase [Pedobacter sp. MC2016-15]|uniref:glycosyltransferase n=1 Tax=Pedobacter sp. MC2016-15 TaxID=2994473 RepID=UPI002245CDE2|nr:glycosyltransferase [Pedobacter sp. MC2016-15]MCX2478651.1 glycosyltransferase [Pedobacter sp. MC2016-15]
MSSIAEVDYSIIICSYNPDDHLLKRCLRAVSALFFEGLRSEIILVDNNSTAPLAEKEYIKQFVQDTGASLLQVSQPGLRYARMAAIEASKGKYVVFFDDDNEPDPNYLQELSALNRDLPTVAAWGPGIVDVDFINGISKELKSYATEAFQDRHETSVTYSNQHSWQPCYPYGTGMCLRKNYLINYLSLAEKNKFTLTGRKGLSMSSGEDIQMVLFCISKGAAAGVAPGLKLTHMIPSKRANFDYLKKLTYGTSVCYSTCVFEVFPDSIQEVENRAVSERRFVKKAMKKYFKLIFQNAPEKTFDLINYIGVVSGDYMVLNKSVPSSIKWILKKLKAF